MHGKPSLGSQLGRVATAMAVLHLQLCRFLCCFDITLKLHVAVIGSCAWS